MFQSATLPEDITFVILAVIMVGAALRVVTTKNVVHAALYLVMVLAGVAAQYILLGSEFLAITQVLVYIGAIVVLFLFGIMLTRAELGISNDLDNDGTQKAVAAGVGVLLAGVMIWALLDKWKWSETPIPLIGRTTEQLGQTTPQISDSIFGPYLVPFEAAAVLLLAALIGAIVLARRD
jgi:NADH-quinone oxidoreductase subunit J